MIHVLLVDDDLSFRRSLMIQMELEGCRVTEADSGSDAVSKLEYSEKKGLFPDVVVTDMRMPEMDGTAFLRVLKDQYPQIPVVVMSAFEPPDDIPLELFLHKPFKIVDMMETVTHVIGLQ